MRFSPILIGHSIIAPLRYFFANYAGEDLFYDDDEKKSKIEIGSIYNYHKIPFQIKPRILVNRGSYTITGSGLSDNLTESAGISENKGLSRKTNQVFINGMASIIIESNQEGALEKITDMVTHFLVWSRPFISDSQGFKNFAMPLSVSDPVPAKEEKEIFQVTIQVPYTCEEHWMTRDDALKLNNIKFNLTADT